MSFAKSSSQSVTTAVFAGTVCSNRCTSRNCQLEGSDGMTNDESAGKIASNIATPAHANRGEVRLSDPHVSAKSARTIARPMPDGSIYLATNIGVIRYESTNKITGADSSKYPASSRAVL